jgi:putative DNA primase/helicase
VTHVSCDARRWYAEGLGWDVVPVWGVGADGACGCGAPGCADAGKHRADAWLGTPWQSWPDDLNIGALHETAGIVVLSVDVHRRGASTIDAVAVEASADLRDTWVVQAGLHHGQRTEHRYFRLPAALLSTAGVSLRRSVPGHVLGVSVYYDRYTVVPPSSHASGETYAWDAALRPGTVPLAELPATLAATLRTDVPGTAVPGGPVVGGTDWSDAGRVQRLTVQRRRAGLKTAAVELYQRFNGSKLETATWLYRLAELAGLTVDDEELQLVSYVDMADAAARGRGAGGGVGGPGSVGGTGGGGPGDDDSIGPPGQVGHRTTTENGNGRRLVDLWGDDLRYTPGQGWYYWTGDGWAHDVERLKLMSLVRELPVHVVSELPNWLPTDHATVIDWAARSKAANVMKKTAELASNDPRVYLQGSSWDSDQFTLGVANGVVDLRTGELLPASRDQLITKRTPIAYVPGKKDVRWDIFLDQATNGDKEYQAWLQRAVGYTLTGDTREEKLFVVYGPPGSGKSTFLDIVTALLGSYAITLDAAVIMQDRPGAAQQDYYFNAQIAGTRLIAVSELPDAQNMKEAAVKRLTGGDTMVGRHPGERPFTFTSHAKLWVATNHQPRIDDIAMWRRLLALPFTYVPQVVDKSLKPYLRDPEGGLGAALAWAAEGAVRWSASRDGIGACEVVKRATEEYRQNEDRIGIFLAEEATSAEGTTVDLQDLHAAYDSWSQERLEKPMGQTAFRKKLVERGIQVDKSGRTTIIRGWSLVPRPVENTWDRALRVAR